VFVFSSGSVWLKVNPPGFRRLLNYIKDNYNNVPVFVTENGITDNNGTVHDQHRISYYYKYMNELLKGIYIECYVSSHLIYNLMKRVTKYLVIFSKLRNTYN